MSLCHVQDEHVLHCLKGCPVMRRFWLSQVMETDVQSLLVSGVDGTNGIKFSYGSFLPYARKASFGGLICKVASVWLFGFYEFAGSMDILHAQLLGIKHGLYKLGLWVVERSTMGQTCWRLYTYYRDGNGVGFSKGILDVSNSHKNSFPPKHSLPNQ